ncbi:hypothetical protein K466DRAFT_76724 [Polyporus arcularius HHB13444]|uniref:RING-type domain-containing protein n=1 Tax=Polyporus arcularius HHB13444 TaxID=1314778 RepID=A0A5C3PG74_9APHY|nr:hypothetical protein K466DRAFT_76724 [Polyporus arcularius HHB13444]
MHPTCYRCGLGFVSMTPFVEHRASCPSVGPSRGTRMKVKVAVARDVEPVPDSSVDKERPTRVAPNEDCATLEDSSGMRTIPFADSWSEQSSVTPTKPATSVTPRLPSPTPSAAVSSHTHSSSETIAWQPVLDERRDRVSRELDRPNACPPPRSSTAAESNESAPNATECSVVLPTLPPDPAAHRSDGSPRKHPVLSYHCRACLRDPCIEPVATICGHLFCHRCILEEMMSRMGCPVCGKTFLVKLHVEL